MKKRTVRILAIICALNLLGCAGQTPKTVTEGDGMLTEAEIDIIFGALHRTEAESDAESAKTEILADRNQDEEIGTENTAETSGQEEVAAESADGVPVQYSGLFQTGDFDENLVWTAYNDEYAELIEEMRAFCEENATGSVMLATDEEVLFAGGFNAKETDEETTVNPFTTYEIGSLTQPFMAAAILQQIQEGNLSASDTLDKFFPDYPHGSEISVDNLLHMDSGIPDYINDSMHFFKGRTAEGYEAFMNGQMPDEEILEFMYNAELSFEPGKKADSSNTNYYLLALILEQITGMPYEDYMQTYLLDMCGLESTTCTETGNLTSVPQGNGSYMTFGRVVRGAGDMHSNVCDILIFDRELMAGRIINEEHLEYMTEARNGYACGWFEAGEGSVGQYSSTDGYICVNFIYRIEEENYYFIMMIPNGRAWALPGKTMDVLESHLN